MTAPRIRLIEAEAFERPVTFRFPFRFGAARVTAAPQAFLRVRIEDNRGQIATGWAADMMMPKWFDKRPDPTPDDNIADLRASLRRACDMMLDAGTGTAFGLHTAVEDPLHLAGIPGLVASFGLAMVDRAILDALGRLHNQTAGQMVRANLPGITTATTPDLANFDLNAFLTELRPSPTIALRHTVGLADALTPAGKTDWLDDGLPETLQDAIATQGLRFFKLKLSGQPEADIDRLTDIAAVLDSTTDTYQATLDGNEQFVSPEAVADLLDRLDKTPSLARLRKSLLFLEQPLPRAGTQSLHAIAARLPVEIDEADDRMDAFLNARDKGYTGVSAKSCKGFYRAILNRARIAHWNSKGERTFMSAEDLTTQGGIGIQQDLALATLIGATHVERNGHHYVNGMAGAPEAEQEAFLQNHGDLYQATQNRTRLAIRAGALDLTSINAAPGLGSFVEPDWSAMEALK